MKNRNVLIISPSQIVSKGLERVFLEHSEFRVGSILTELPRNPESLRSSGFDLVIIDPCVIDYGTRANVHNSVCEALGVPVIAVQTSLLEEDFWRQFDAVFSLYDLPTVIISKCRKALDVDLDSSKSEGGELSSREKEILVSVAKGKLNKEIADEYNISVYTVMTHRKNITRKTGIKTVAGLTVYAMLNNLIDPSTLE